MSNIKLIIEERAADIGNFLVGRLLPFRQKRSVGPFVFIDHMGPTFLKAGENFDIGPHPHLGLSTLTFLFEGNIMHRDSTGAVCEIEPGAVNWMTAGKGVVHSERTPDRLRYEDKTMHGFQIWVALPKHKENVEPSFTHINPEDLPSWKIGNADLKLVAGEAFGYNSPVPVHSKLFFIEIKTKEPQLMQIGADLYGEAAMYVLNGTVKSGDEKFGGMQLLVAKDAALCEFEMQANSTVYLFGGEPFPEERHIFWNFVHSDRKMVKKAAEDWLNRKFPTIPGDEKDYVPLPDGLLKLNIK